MKRTLAIVVLVCAGAGCGLEIGHRPVNNTSKTKSKPANQQNKNANGTQASKKDPPVPPPTADLPAPIEHSQIAGLWEEVIAEDKKAGDSTRRAWWFIGPNHVTRRQQCTLDGQLFTMRVATRFARKGNTNVLSLAQDRENSKLSADESILCEAHLNHGNMYFEFKEGNLILLMGDELVTLRRPVTPQS